MLMHGALFLGTIKCVPSPLDVDLELEFELVEVDLVDPDAIQGTDVNAGPQPEPEPEPPAPEPPPEEPPKEEPAKEEPPKEEPVVDEGPKRDLGKKKSRVGKLGPPSANYHVLLSTRNIRKLPFGQDAMKIVAPLPDFEYLVARGGFDALKDFDHILIASSNLRSVTQTFLAVDYRISREAVKAKIETAVRKSNQTIEWTEHGGALSGNPIPADGSADDDPRHFVLLEKKVAVLVRPEFLPAVLGENVGEEKTAANFVGELTKLRRYARRMPTAGLQFVAHDLHAALKRTSTSKFDLPNDIELTIEAQKDPEIHIRMKFTTASGAKGFVTWLKTDIRDWLAQYFLAGVFDALEIEQKNRELTIWGELDEMQMNIILPTAAGAVEKEQARVRKRAKKRRAAAEKKKREAEGAAP